VGLIAVIIKYKLTDIYILFNKPLRCGAYWALLSHNIRRTGFEAYRFIVKKC